MTTARTRGSRLLDVPVLGSLLRAVLLPRGADQRLARVASAARSSVAAPVAAAPTNESSDRARVLFRLSTERSGSTLFSLALGRNARHVTPPEMHLLAYPTFEAWRKDYQSAIASLPISLQAAGTEEGDDAVASRFAGWAPEAVYRWVLDGRLADEKLFIDKTPKYARDPETLARIESLAPRYIWLVRHPMAVAASQIALRRERSLARATATMRWLAPLKRWLIGFRERVTAPELLRQEVAYWRALNEHIERFLAGVDPARWRRVSLEAFVREPENVLRDVCTWLGSEFDAAMLDPRENIPHEMRPELGDPKVRRHQQIDAAVADAWRNEYTDDWLDADTRRAMARWGVPPR